MTLNVTLLLSGSGSTFAAIEQFSRRPDSHFKITHVVSDQPKAYGLERASELGIETIVVPYQSFQSRADFDQALQDAVVATKPALVVLAGFMRIVAPSFVRTFDGKLLNIHPSLLPKFPGLHTYARALEAGESHHGSTVHFVNDVLDGGPAIAQAIVIINDNDNVSTLSARVQAAERILYPNVINWFALNRLRQKGKGVVLDGKLLSTPLQLPWNPTTGEIDFELA